MSPFSYYAKAALVVLAALIAPIRPVLLACTALVGADLITGLLKARKRKEVISAYKLRRTLVKTSVYLSAIVLGHITEKWLLDGFLPVTKLISGAIGVVELKSCLENLQVVSGTDVLKGAIDRLTGPRQDPGPKTP